MKLFKYFAILTVLCGSFNSFAQSDDVIIKMSDAFRRKNTAQLGNLAYQAAGHPLEPWAGYWDMSSRLEYANEAEVEDVLNRFAGSYQEDRLRNDWLLVLGRRGDWANFNKHLAKYRMNDDPEVRCYAVAAAGRTSPADAALVMDNWYNLRKSSDACSYAAGFLYNQKALRPEALWRMARVGAEANQMRAVQQAVDIVAPEAGVQVFRMYSNPMQYLNEFSGQSSSERELAALALIRLAMSGSDNAAYQLQSRFDKALSSESRSWAYAVIAKQQTLEGNPQSEAHFNQSRSNELSDDLLGWKVRSALRAGNWTEVDQSIAFMSPASQALPIWSYWRGRAMQATRTGRPADLFVRAARGSVLGDELNVENKAGQELAYGSGIEGFYAQLATEALGHKITLPPAPPAPSAAELEAARQNPGIARALYAMQIGLKTEGNKEWNYTTNLHQKGGMSDRERLAAAQIACDMQYFDRCINTSERTRAAFNANQRYPTPMLAQVSDHARRLGIDPADVYGLIRQESRFMSVARSGVGASGLMQVMKNTARIVAKRIGLGNVSDRMLADPDTNLMLGTNYLRMVLDNFEGSKPMALAAYNAGPGRPNRWREFGKVEPAIWAETIPFFETRDYVKKVLSNSVIYAAMLTGQPQSLLQQLGPEIGPRPYEAPPVLNDFAPINLNQLPPE